MLVNIIVSLIIIALLSLAAVKIIKDKKNGIKCSGCPSSKSCSSENDSKKC